MFFLNHPDLLAVQTTPGANGNDTVSGYSYIPSQLQAAISDPSLNPIAAQWINQWINQDMQSGGNDSQITNMPFGTFLAALAVIKQQSIEMSTEQTNLTILQALDPNDPRIPEYQARIQGYQDDITAARQKVQDYAANVIRTGAPGPQAAPSDAGADAAVTAEQVEQAVEAEEAEADAEGDAIARAYVDPTGLLNGENQALTSTQANAMIQRIRVAETATSATVVGASASADGASTAPSDPLTVVAPDPIYKNYKVSSGANGALVVSVPTLQVQTRSGVTTFPSNQIAEPSTQVAVTSSQIKVASTQVNVTSNQVSVTSTQVDVPSTQVSVPSTQLQTPSAVMTSPDLEPSLCGR